MWQCVFMYIDVYCVYYSPLLYCILSDTLSSTHPVAWLVAWSGFLTTSLRTFSPTKSLGEHQGENVALFLQAVRVCLRRKWPKGTANSESFEHQLDASKNPTAWSVLRCCQRKANGKKDAKKVTIASASSTKGTGVCRMWRLGKVQVTVFRESYSKCCSSLARAHDSFANATFSGSICGRKCLPSPC